MPNCAAVNCSNRHEKGFRLFRFPSDKQRRELWVHNINRASWEPTNSSSICEIHFDDSQFEQHRADGWRKLKPNAVPTRFSIPKPLDIAIDPLSNKTAKRALKRTCHDDSENVKDSTKCKTSTENKSPSPIKDIGSSKQLHLRKHNQSERLNKERNVENVSELNKKLKLAQKRIHLLEAKMKKIEATLNTDQISFLLSGNRKTTKWSKSTMEKAFKLYMTCGTKGYQEIRDQKLPFPPIKTLQDSTQRMKQGKHSKCMGIHAVTPRCTTAISARAIATSHTWDNQDLYWLTRSFKEEKP